MKRLCVFGAAALFALVVCVPLLPAVGSTETWADVSKKLLAECEKFQKGAQDMTITMEMEVPSSEGTMKTEQVLYRKGDRFRVEVTMSGMGDVDVSAALANLKTTIIGDGTNVWIIAPMMGKSQIPAEEGKKYRGQWACGDYIPLDAEVVGSETVNGRLCYVLSVLDAGSDFAKLWIDQKNLTLVKLEGKANEGETMIALFSDFKKVPGIGEMAHRTDMYSGTDLISTAVITSVKVNTGLADDLFDADKVKAEGSGLQEMLDKMKDE